MAIDNVQAVLSKQIGTNKCDVISTTAMTDKDYYCIYFPVESVIASIVATNATTATGSAIANLHTTMAAGTTLFLNITDVTLTSGVGMCYYTQAQ
jgi:hypothetical protein